MNIDKLMKTLLVSIEQVGLLIILIATLVAIGQEIMVIIAAQHVKLADLLLLFIYLEVVSMVGIYFHSRQLPVRFPLYIAMAALARYIILDSKEMTPLGMLAVAVTILLLATSVLVIRYGHIRFPYNEKDKAS